MNLFEPNEDGVERGADIPQGYLAIARIGWEQYIVIRWNEVQQNWMAECIPDEPLADRFIYRKTARELKHAFRTSLDPTGAIPIIRTLKEARDSIGL